MERRGAKEGKQRSKKLSLVVVEVPIPDYNTHKNVGPPQLELSQDGFLDASSPAHF